MPLSTEHRARGDARMAPVQTSRDSGALPLALAIHRVFPHGGLQRDAIATARACRARGHRVLLVTQRLEGPVPEGVEVQVLATRGLTNHGRARSFGPRARAAADAFGARALLGFDKLPWLDAYFVGDPCYARRARERRGALSRWTPRDRTFRSLERAVFGPAGARAILLLHEGQDAPFRAEYGTEPGRFRVLPPGIARDRRRGADAPARRARTRAALGAADDDVLLLQLGSDYLRKGVDRTARAVAALPPALRRRALLLVAGADRRERVAAALDPLGERARVLGARDDVPDLLLAADVLVHPARSEPGGVVLLEALVAGTPVIASGACGYAPRVAAAGAGIVLPEPFEQAALDRAVHELVASPAVRATYAARALAHADATPELFGMHERIVDVLEELAR